MLDPRIIPIDEIMQRYEKLTERQRNVVNCLAQGLCIKEIASCLDISPRTAELHINAIYNHFEVRKMTPVAIMIYRAQTEGNAR